MSKKIAVYGKEFNIDHSENITLLLECLQSHSFDFMIEAEYYSKLKQGIPNFPKLDRFYKSDFEQIDFDYFLSLGGDGTILESVTIVKDSGVPIVGVNTGRLGYLSRISLNEIAWGIQKLADNDYTVEGREMLQMTTEIDGKKVTDFALNELSVHRKDNMSMIKIHVHIDGEFLNTYWSDGLIVATPTGSTAYSLSCGGPIIAPGSENFVITPIAPHNLNMRPVVFHHDTKIQLQVEGRSDEFLATLDSRTSSLPNNSILEIQRNSFTAKFIVFQEHRFAYTIRHKLNWGIDKRN